LRLLAAKIRRETFMSRLWDGSDSQSLLFLFKARIGARRSNDGCTFTLEYGDLPESYLDCGTRSPNKGE